MVNYFTYYAEANTVCLVVFGILLFHDLLNIDRQEKQIKYDHALATFMLYFVSDTLCSAVTAGVLPFNKTAVVITRLCDYFLMAGVTYFWLRFVMAVEQTPHRERRINKIAVVFPFLISTIVMVLVYCFAPHVLLNDDLEVQYSYYIFLIIVPCINIAAVIVYTMKKAIKAEDFAEKRKHLYIGLFPLLVVGGGLLEILLFPELPIFCFCCTLLMLIFYIRSMETQISTDPLTKLNNRSQLLKYISQPSNLYMSDRKTFVVMIDVNEFKSINDTYGHAEGDKALVFIADSIKKVTVSHDMPTFIGRYGGDEFILIVHPVEKDEVDILIDEIRKEIETGHVNNDAPYRLSICAGYDELIRGQGTVQKCIQHADDKMYVDKKYNKKSYSSED